MYSNLVPLLLSCTALTSAWSPLDGDKLDQQYSRLFGNANANGKTVYSRGIPSTSRSLKRSPPAGAVHPAVSSGNTSAPIPARMRGVNLGALFVFEPWIDEAEWSRIGCGGQASEFDCGKALGQTGVNNAMKMHWESYYTQDDFTQMKALGLNSVRIPVGYWMREDIVDRASEPFPEGGFAYLVTICGWASDAGLTIIMDHHGAPGAQVASNADTGQNNPNPGFYTSANYERSYKFLEWMAQKIHTTPEMRNVAFLEILNEPEQNNAPTSMRQTFYPTAITRIRAAETALKVTAANQLNIMMMNKVCEMPARPVIDMQLIKSQLWGSGDPKQYLGSDTGLAFDDHRYLKWAYQQAQTKDAYMQTACSDNRGSPGETPTITAEWSMSAPLDGSQQSSPEWDPKKNVDWYLGWFSAATRNFEKQGRFTSISSLHVN